jgi:hypothetical protein
MTLAMHELAEIYEAQGEVAMAHNLRRHLNNISAFEGKKRSGAKWASEAWQEYVADTGSEEQRGIARRAWRRKKELGMIRDQGQRGQQPWQGGAGQSRGGAGRGGGAGKGRFGY